MQHLTDYHRNIIEYYQVTENAYKDAWDLDKSLAIHYGYMDEKTRNFSESLIRMNEIMMEAAQVIEKDHVLDAGCGVGGSALFLAAQTGCQVTGITLSEQQVERAKKMTEKKLPGAGIEFLKADYCNTVFADESFDVVWGCESICYAADKLQFIREAYRLLKPGGRLVVADGFIKEFGNNEHSDIRKWLQGWQVNYLETPERFGKFMKDTGFENVYFRDISKHVMHSAKRLYRFYYFANIYLLWKKLTFSDHFSWMQKQNIDACRYQYKALRKGLWLYGLTVGIKPC